MAPRGVALASGCGLPETNEQSEAVPVSGNDIDLGLLPLSQLTMSTSYLYPGISCNHLMQINFMLAQQRRG